MRLHELPAVLANEDGRPARLNSLRRLAKLMVNLVATQNTLPLGRFGGGRIRVPHRQRGNVRMARGAAAKREPMDRAWRAWALRGQLAKERLALDALATEWASTPPASQRHTGSLRGDLLTRFRPWIRQLNRKPYARVVAGLVAEAQTNPEFAGLYRRHFVQARRDATREILVRARDRGEIAANTDLDVTLDLLYGPIYHRLLHGHAPLTERFAQQVIDYVIAAISEKEHTESQ
jgi:hypothetical protein